MSNSNCSSRDHLKTTTSDIKIILGGTIAGFAQVFTGHPFDTIKVRHINSIRLNPNTTLYNTITSSYRKGFKSFYRGVTSPMLGSVIMNIQTFYVYNYIKRVLNNQGPLLCGGLTGLSLAIVETPADLIKTKLQINNLGYKNTVKQIGLNIPFGDHSKNISFGDYTKNNLYKGFCITSIRNFSSVGLFFWGYENTVSSFDNKYVGSFIGGAVAGFMCWGLNYPLDNIKTQIQINSKLTTRDIIKNVVKTKSYGSLWAGFLPCIVRAVCVNPFVFLGYELGKSLI